jgi:DNA-binding response OmpR family regulator
MAAQKMLSPQKVNIRVLLMSNDPIITQLWHNSLSQNGFIVVVVGTAEGALDCWARESFDLTIIDVGIYILGGIKLCYHLRTRTVTPILLLSYSSSKLFVLKAFEAEVDDYIVKPVSPDLLLAKVRALLRR